MMPEKTWLNFPGLPQVSAILCCTLQLVGEITVFVMLLMALKYYVPGRSRGNHMFGKLIGLLASIFAAKQFTVTLGNYFPVDQVASSAVLIIFIIINSTLTAAVYRSVGGTNDLNS
jgi:hypothetical protein